MAQILSHLESPASNEASVFDSCLVRGWTCSPDGIAGIEFHVDGVAIDRCVPEGERPDVAAAFPHVSGARRSGFERTLNLASLSRGTHHLEIVITALSGEECRHRRTLEIAADHYQRVLVAAQLRTADRNRLLAFVDASAHAPCFELWVDARAGAGVDATLRSIRAQTYSRWQLRTVRDDEPFPASIDAAQGAAAEYVAFLSAGEVLLPDALLHVAAALVQAPAPVVYSDHDRVAPDGLHSDPEFAPDWSPEFLYAHDYVGGVFFVSRDALRGHALTTQSPAWRYDLFLRVSETAERICHVPRVLWSATAAPDPHARNSRRDAERDAVNAALLRCGGGAVAIAMPDAPVRRVLRPPAITPLVSIIVPTTGRIELVRSLVESITRVTSYPQFELVFLDNGRGEHPDGIAYLRGQGVRVIEVNEPFNWARLNNVGARASRGGLLLFLNDDIEACDPGWLEELVSQALVPDVGAVGAMLTYPDGRIQHGGVFLVDHGGGARHFLQFAQPAGGAYETLANATREVTAVTGACLMIRRQVFDDLGGFNEEFRIAFNDVDLCLRLGARGYRNIWTPHCRLVHHESISRGGSDISGDEQRVWDTWGARLREGDAYHNPNLAKDRADCTVNTSIQAPAIPDLVPAAAGRGVNLIGYIRAEMGVGEAARGMARAMDAAATPFVILDYEYGNPARKADTTWANRVVEHPAYDVNLLVVNADLTPEACTRLGTELFDDRYTIAYWHWELPELPDRWLAAFDYVDEVWVSTEFVRAAVAAKSPVPVTRVPIPIDKSPGPYLDRPYFDLPVNAFLFLSMYDTQSIMERKNPAGAIAAFRSAFAPDDMSVGLVVKVNQFTEQEGATLRAQIGDHRNIRLIDRTLSRYEVDSLLHCCDAFVSLHRSEGFGLPIAESMAMGKPVIATHWSGNADFMDATCAACVDFELRPLGRDYGPYEAHQHWAEPSLSSASGWMRTLAGDPAAAASLGAAGRQRMREGYSSDAAGQVLQNRLDAIRDELGSPGRTPRMIRQMEIRQAALADATAAVTAARAEIADLRQALEAAHATAGAGRETIERLQTDNRSLQEALADHRAALSRAEAAMKALQAELAEHRGLRDQVAELDGRVRSLLQGLDEARSQLAAVRTSFSWRVTAPLRAIVRRLGGPTTDAALRHTPGGSR